MHESHSRAQGYKLTQWHMIRGGQCCSRDHFPREEKGPEGEINKPSHSTTKRWRQDLNPGCVRVRITQKSSSPIGSSTLHSILSKPLHHHYKYCHFSGGSIRVALSLSRAPGLQEGELGFSAATRLQSLEEELPACALQRVSNLIFTKSNKGDAVNEGGNRGPEGTSAAKTRQGVHITTTASVCLLQPLPIRWQYSGLSQQKRPLAPTC